MHMSVFSCRYRGASQSPYREGTLQNTYREGALLEIWEAPIKNRLYEAPKGFIHTFQSFPTNIGVLHQAYIDTGLHSA